jgi:hypothetical protein
MNRKTNKRRKIADFFIENTTFSYEWMTAGFSESTITQAEKFFNRAWEKFTNCLQSSQVVHKNTDF